MYSIEHVLQNWLSRTVHVTCKSKTPIAIDSEEHVYSGWPNKNEFWKLFGSYRNEVPVIFKNVHLEGCESEAIFFVENA